MAIVRQYDSGLAGTLGNSHFCYLTSSIEEFLALTNQPVRQHWALIAMTTGTVDSFPFGNWWPNHPNVLCQRMIYTAQHLHYMWIENKKSQNDKYLHLGRNMLWRGGSFTGVCLKCKQRHKLANLLQLLTFKCWKIFLCMLNSTITIIHSNEFDKLLNAQLKFDLWADFS